MEGRRIKLPVVGWIKTRESIRFLGKLKRATVSREAGRWFVAVMVETEIAPTNDLNGTVGVDLGVKALATLSNGEVVEGPKAHKAALKRLRRASKALSRKRRGSANFRKQKARLARLHARVSRIRRDSLHKLTTRLATTFAVIGIEDLNVRGMIRNRSLSRSISDVGLFEFRRQLEYKARIYGSTVVTAPRFYPSSKTCCRATRQTDPRPT
jgi:putative transposase